jgi:hypothetical protein
VHAREGENKDGADMDLAHQTFIQLGILWRRGQFLGPLKERSGLTRDYQPDQAMWTDQVIIDTAAQSANVAKPSASARTPDLRTTGCAYPLSLSRGVATRQ